MSDGSLVRELLKLRVPPIAVGFFDAPPPGLSRWDEGPVPSGCTFWLKAQEGKSFYTMPSDHYNCAIGSYTHSIDLPADRSDELPATVGLMVETKYLEESEVAGIPRLERSPGVVAYGPVDSAGFEPAVVVIAANPAQQMLLYEAALRAGAGDALTNLIGRPGCAVLPLALTAGTAAMSLGCIGNRFHTGLPDSEFYSAIPGNKWQDVAARLEEIVEANAAMTRYYDEHLTRIAGAGP